MAETTNHNTQNFAGNIDLSELRKKRFTVDNDENRVLELNTSDFSIINRLSEMYPKLTELTEKITHLNDGVSESDEGDSLQNDLTVMSGNLTSADTEIRKLVDYIFDSNVCEVCCPSGSMLDLINGQFRYEFIINALMSLYETTIKKETAELQKKMSKHTDKYVKH